MQNLIHAYEASRAVVQQRIRELNQALLDDTMMHREREDLKKRRDLLMSESFDMLHIIAELKSRCS